MTESIEERVKILEHNFAELQCQHYCTRILLTSLFIAHPDRAAVMNCYEFFRKNWKEMALGQPFSDALIEASDSYAVQFQKMLQEISTKLGPLQKK